MRQPVTPAADRVRTTLLLSYGSAVEHRDAGVPGMASVYREYLARLLRLRMVEEEPLLAWEAVVTAGRLAEPVSKGLLRTTCQALADGEMSVVPTRGVGRARRGADSRACP